MEESVPQFGLKVVSIIGSKCEMSFFSKPSKFHDTFLGALDVAKCGKVEVVGYCCGALLYSFFAGKHETNKTEGKFSCV